MDAGDAGGGDVWTRVTQGAAMDGRLPGEDGRPCCSVQYWVIHFMRIKYAMCKVLHRPLVAPSSLPGCLQWLHPCRPARPLAALQFHPAPATSDAPRQDGWDSLIGSGKKIEKVQNNCLLI